MADDKKRRKDPGRRWEATQATTTNDLVRVMTKIGATSLKIEQDIMGKKVKVVFDRAGRRYVRECETYKNSLDNLRAIGLQIDFLYRALEVLGQDIKATSFNVEFDRIFAGFIADPDDNVLKLGSGNEWWRVLGVEPNATKAAIRNAYHALAPTVHPDIAGQEKNDDFVRLTKAYEEGMKQAKS